MFPRILGKKGKQRLNKTTDHAVFSIVGRPTKTRLQENGHSWPEHFCLSHDRYRPTAHAYCLDCCLLLKVTHRGEAIGKALTSPCVGH